MKNLFQRIASGLTYLGILAVALFCGQIFFAIIFSLFIIIAMREYLHITIGNAFKFGQVVSIIMGLVLFLGIFLYEGGHPINNFLVLSLPLLLAVLFALTIYVKNTEEYKKYTFLLSSLFYIAIPISFFSFAIFDDNYIFSGKILLILFILQIASDVGAYFFGTLFGQKNGHKLCPKISPHKSWEGFLGGILVTIAAALIISSTGMLEISIIKNIVLALIICIFGLFGDLTESRLKRSFNIKDSGKIMPGHGGLLDRLDSSILSFPVAIAYLIIIGIL